MPGGELWLPDEKYHLILEFFNSGVGWSAKK